MKVGVILDKKICLHCNIEKSIEDFPRYKNRDGSFSYRNVCKNCRYLQKKVKGKSGIKTNVVNMTSVAAKTERKKDVNYMPELNKEQKEKLLKLLNSADDLIDLLNNKIEINVDEDKTNRIVKTINFDSNLYEVIKEKSKEKNISISDMVNLLIGKGLKYL